MKQTYVEKQHPHAPKQSLSKCNETKKEKLDCVSEDLF